MMKTADDLVGKVYIKGRFVALSLFVLVCATGICYAHGNEKCSESTAVSVWDVDFLEPSSRLLNFVITYAMQEVRIPTINTEELSVSSENKPTSKQQRLWRIIAESCIDLLGEIVTDVMYTELEDKTTKTVAPVTDGFVFPADFASDNSSETQFLNTRNDSQR